MACFSYIEGFYNPLRLHSGLGYRYPVQFERGYYNDQSIPVIPQPEKVH